MGQLQVDDVCVTFGALRALEHVSLTVNDNEVLGVIGPNGAGKTTLFNVMCGFVRPTSGTLRVNGKALQRHQPHQLAGLGIARTLQGVGLWPGLTVVENVMAGATSNARAGFAANLLGLRRAARDEAELEQRALKVLGELRVEEYARRSPATLPYAIQKRVALARALVNEPSILLLDEPASGLSQLEMDELGSLIVSLRARMSVLLVEHHMDLVMSICNRLVVLDFGQVIATGRPAEVKVDPAVTRAYLGVDASELDPVITDREPSDSLLGGPDA